MLKLGKKLKASSDETTKVEVSFPSKIKIDLVQGNELRHYEIFSLACSILLSTAVGFWTGYLTSDVDSRALFASALTFSLLSIGSGILAWYYRSKLYDGKVTKTSELANFS